MARKIVYLGKRSIKSTRLNGVVYRLIIGSRGACVQFRGKTYDLIYSPRAYPLLAPPGTRNPRVTPKDARRLLWKALDEVHCVIGGARFGLEELVIRLGFRVPVMYRDSAGAGDYITFIALSDRKTRIRTIAANRMPVEATRTSVAQNDETVCYVCLHNTPNAILRPCNHSNICCACAYMVQSTAKCPLCRGNVAYFVRKA
jgi:hypothetical protein